MISDNELTQAINETKLQLRINLNAVPTLLKEQMLEVAEMTLQMLRDKVDGRIRQVGSHVYSSSYIAAQRFDPSEGGVHEAVKEESATDALLKKACKGAAAGEFVPDPRDGRDYSWLNKAVKDDEVK